MHIGRYGHCDKGSPRLFSDRAFEIKLWSGNTTIAQFMMARGIISFLFAGGHNMSKSRRSSWIFFSVFSIFLSHPAAADMWSGCVHITSVTEFPWNIQIGIPDLPQQCHATGYAPTLIVQVGQGPAGFTPTIDSIKGLRMQALLAKITGERVMIYFAESDLNTCYVGIIAIGGHSMQCN